MNPINSTIQALEQQLAAVADAIATSTTELGQAALAVATGQKPGTPPADIEAALEGLALQQRRLEAALAAANAAAARASTADLQAQLDAAISNAQDAGEQVKHALALDEALRAALLAAQGLAQAGQARRHHLLDAGRALTLLVPGTPGLAAAAMCSHLADGSAVRTSSVVGLLNDLGKALGLPIDLSTVGTQPGRTTADLLAADNEFLAARLATWTPENARAALAAMEA